MAWTLLLGFVALTLVFVWMLAVRYRIEVLRTGSATRSSRSRWPSGWAEGDTPPAPSGSDTPPAAASAGAGGADREPAMSYVDAGYVIALRSLFFYAVEPDPAPPPARAGGRRGRRTA